MDFNFYLLEPDNFATLTLDENFDGFSYCISNDHLYLLGGGNAEINAENLQIMYIYDIIHNTWTKKEDINIPNDIKNAATVAYKGDIYFFGGYKTNAIRKYRTYTDEWLPYYVGMIPTSSKIDCKSQYYVAKPFVRNNFVYLAPLTLEYINLRGSVIKYDLENESLDTTSVGCLHGQNNIYFEFYNGESNTFQYLRTLHSYACAGCRTKAANTYSTKAEAYSIEYSSSSQSLFPAIVTKIDENKILDIRTNLENNNKVQIKILNSNEAMVSGTNYNDIEEIEHYFEDPVYITMGQVQSFSTKDSKGRIVVPYFTSTEKNEIKLFMIGTPNYIINSDQTIETTEVNKITDICDVISTNIDYELEDNTSIRIAISTDNKNTYKYLNGNQWKTITDKNMNKNNEGMTPDEFKKLTKSDFKLLFGDSVSNNIDIIVSLYSTNSNHTPKIRSISIKTSNLM